jgi:hypothetical protein
MFDCKLGMRLRNSNCDCLLQIVVGAVVPFVSPQSGHCSEQVGVKRCSDGHKPVTKQQVDHHFHVCSRLAVTFVQIMQYVFRGFCGRNLIKRVFQHVFLYGRPLIFCDDRIEMTLRAIPVCFKMHIPWRVVISIQTTLCGC